MSSYTYKIIEGKPQIASIELSENVLGGNDAQEFSAILYELFDKGLSCVVIDLKKVQVMNSSGLGMMVSGLSSLRKNNIQMALIYVPDKVMSLLSMTHLDKVFQIVNNIEEVFAKYS